MPSLGGARARGEGAVDPTRRRLARQAAALPGDDVDRAGVSWGRARRGTSTGMGGCVLVRPVRRLS